MNPNGSHPGEDGNAPLGPGPQHRLADEEPRDGVPDGQEEGTRAATGPARRSPILRATPTVPGPTEDRRPSPSPLPPDRVTPGPATPPPSLPRQRGTGPASAPRRLAEPRPAATPPSPPAADPPDTTHRRSAPSWKILAAGLLAAALAFWVFRGVTGSPTAPSARSPESGRHAVTVPHARPTLERVRLNGAAIQAAGPILTVNPSLAQPGAALSLSASGFDPGAVVDVTVSAKGAKTGTSVGTFKTDKNGSVSGQVQLPERLPPGSVVLTARERNSDKTAVTEAVTSSGLGTVSLSKATGQPGKTISVSARGFAPSETVKVYWGRASGPASATLQTDGGGGIGQAPVQVGVGAVGATTVVLVGQQSGTTATAPFYRLGLYPVASAHPYALKAGEDLGLSASGFAPNEPVLVYVNASSGSPAMEARADSQGNLGGAGFRVPFGLRGSQTLVMVGEQSRASVSSGFDVLPYTPTVQPSTFGGTAGTSFGFFAKGFAPHEVVRVYLGRTKDSAGQLVSAFRVDAQGAAGAAGSYQISTRDQGTLTFTLVGQKSDGRTTTSVKASPASGPVNLPPPTPYKLPPSLRR